MKLSILYRGPLSSCNYACGYCPFAKRRESNAELAGDRQALRRFLGWSMRQQDRELAILFTPWGEALVRPWYQQALVELSHQPQVSRVAAQTNLSCKLRWVEAADKTRLAFWATYHPGEVRRERFLAQCQELQSRGVRFSVGVVGLKEHREEIAALRRELPAEIYLWINAYKRVPDYYATDELAFLRSVDPLFPINNVRHPSRGQPCRAGESAISVDGDGHIRRCHFLPTVIGNLYDSDWDQCLKPRVCTAETCGCHIGYVHLKHLGLDQTFGDGLLERIPSDPIWSSAHERPTQIAPR